MEDRIPRITNDDIKRIIERDFPKNERDRVIKTLNRYKSESEKGANRVHAAILKIADGSLEKVEKYVEVAIIDYCDMLSWAEYPSYSKNLFEKVSYEKKKQLNDDDWQQ